MAEGGGGGKLVFAINGKRYEPAGIHPSTTLLEFLRTKTPFKGAKLGCGEGGCGACVVLLATYEPIQDEVKEYSVSSCLTLLHSINLCSITTTEGLGNSKDGFHAIHQRFSGFHASQCGFCTPGMCMSLFSALVDADKTDRPEPLHGSSKLTASEAEKAIAGNICRCTGYRPIVDSCKSFAADIDLEDLGLNSFWRKQGNEACISKLPFYNRTDVCTFPEFLKHEIKSSPDEFYGAPAKSLRNLTVSELDNTANGRGASLGEVYWYRPQSVDELVGLLNSGAVERESNIKMVVGNTSSGIYKEPDLYNKYIDLKGISELSVIKRDRESIKLGAAITISRAIEVLKEDKHGLYHSNDMLVFKKIAEHMEKVASQFVRNTASLGGNIMMAQRNQFPSDIATILLAAGSKVCIHKDSKRAVLTLEDFLAWPSCDHKILLISIHIPCSKSATISSCEPDGLVGLNNSEKSILLFETYRAAPRPLGNAVAYINCAFLTQISKDKKTGEFVLNHARLAFGAYGTEHAIRARKVESFLINKSISASVLLEALRLLRKTVVPNEGTPHAAYRSSLAAAFLFKFLSPLANDLSEHVKDAKLDIVKDPSAKASPCQQHGRCEPVDSTQFDHQSMLLSSKQIVESGRDYLPVGEPTKKVGAELQASGEAVYVDDIPSPEGCLYGAFIYSTKPLAYVKGIEFSSTLATSKIVNVITVDDIPKGALNIGSSSMFGSEPLFADSVTTHAGQPLGIVIAESQRLANTASKQAVINY